MGCPPIASSVQLLPPAHMHRRPAQFPAGRLWPPLDASRQRRTTADAVLIAAQPRYEAKQQQQQQQLCTSDTGLSMVTGMDRQAHAPGSSSALGCLLSRRLSRQLSSGSTRAGLLPTQRLLGSCTAPSTAYKPDAGAVNIQGGDIKGCGRASSGISLLSAGAVPPSVLTLGKVLTSAAPLAVLGAGSLLGENLLGYDPEQVRGASGCQWRRLLLQVAQGITITVQHVMYWC